MGAKLVPARKNCSKCGAWLLTCLHFYPAERNEDGTVRRLQAWCNECKRKQNRRTKGIQRRGVPYEAQRHSTPEQRRARRRARHRARQDSRRRHDPLVPIGPFSAWLKELVNKYGIVRVCREACIGHTRLKSFLGEVVKVNGRYEKLTDVKLSLVDDMLIEFDEPLTIVYPPDNYPWLYYDYIPRRYPLRA